MPNQPAPKQAGQGNATPGVFQKYFQNYNTGGSYAPAAPTGFGVTPSAPIPQFGSAQPPTPAAGDLYAGEFGRAAGALTPGAPHDPNLTEAGLALGHAEAPGEQAPGMTGGIMPADQGFFSFLQGAETFVNPLTGRKERTEDAFLAVQENDPAELWEQALQEELGLIAAQTQAALQQQAAIAGSAGLATSGAFSSDIGALRTASGAAGAQTIMQNKEKSDAAHDAWIDRIEAKGTEADQAFDDYENRAETHFTELNDYATGIVNTWGTQLAESGWFTNQKLQNDIHLLVTMIEQNNVAEGPAKAAINSLIATWQDSGLMFMREIGEEPQRYEFHGLKNVTAGKPVSPGEDFESLVWDEAWYGDSWVRRRQVVFGTKLNWS